MRVLFGAQLFMSNMSLKKSPTAAVCTLLVLLPECWLGLATVALLDNLPQALLSSCCLLLQCMVGWVSVSAVTATVCGSD